MAVYKISRMKKEEIPELIEIWRKQYSKYCRNGNGVPDFLSGGETSIIRYLENQISQGNAIVSLKDDVVTGYIAWMYFDFHKEKSAFCPIVGHAAIEEERRKIYLELYHYAAQIWVDDNRFNHLWMIYNDDQSLKDMLYDIGFGSHVIDAYTQISKLDKSDCKYKISAATCCDAEALLALIRESEHFYMDSPIFLKRGICGLNDVINMIETDYLYAAWDNDIPVGIMNLSVQTGYNIENLSSPNTGLINKAGAYIRPEYRGMGIGKCLLNEVMKRCIEQNIQYLHVCFETANPFANRFWRKYFSPVVLSVRRTVNKDAGFSERT